MNKKLYFVYILASQRNGTLYIGVTSDLRKRAIEHKVGIPNSFTSKYRANKLIYFEEYQDVYKAIQREKQLKKWKRAWKINLIESLNPYWIDYFAEID